MNSFPTYHSSSHLTTSAAVRELLNIVHHSPSTEKRDLMQHRLTQRHTNTNTLLMYGHALVSNGQVLPLVVQLDAVAGRSLRLTRFRKAVCDVTDPRPRVQLFY
jgi:hypothetical protein